MHLENKDLNKASCFTPWPARKLNPVQSSLGISRSISDSRPFNIYVYRVVRKQFPEYQRISGSYHREPRPSAIASATKISIPRCVSKAVSNKQRAHSLRAVSARATATSPAFIPEERAGIDTRLSMSRALPSCPLPLNSAP